MTRLELLEETVAKLAARIEQMETFLVADSQFYDHAEEMFTASNLRETVNEVVAADCSVTASLNTVVR